MSGPQAVYLAARYSRAEEMRHVRAALAAVGLRVTSRWIDHHDGTQPTSCTPAELDRAPGRCAPLGLADLEDLRSADTLMAFSSPDGSAGKGGRHVEFGVALALHHRLVLIGRREHVFHTLPQVERFADLKQMLDSFTPAAPAAPGRRCRW